MARRRSDKDKVSERIERLEKEIYGYAYPSEDSHSKLADVVDTVARLEKEMHKDQPTEEQWKDLTDKYKKEQEQRKRSEQEITRLKADIDKKEEEKEGLEQTVNSLKEQIEKDKDRHKEEIKGLTDEKENLEENLDKKKDEISKLESEMNAAKEREDGLRQEVSKLEHLLEDQKKEHQDKVSQMTIAAQLQRDELQKVNQELSDERTVTKQYTDKFGNWNRDTRKYQELLEAVIACDSLGKMMEDYAIDKDAGRQDVTNLIHFIGLLGNEISFLHILYEYLEEYKETCRQTLTDAECELFARVNAYYRSIYQVGYDMIGYPQVGDKFDKAVMKDFDYRTKVYRTVEGVYVPAIRRDGADYLLLALVKGA